jgi:hypothetical protein
MKLIDLDQGDIHILIKVFSGSNCPQIHANKNFSPQMNTDKNFSSQMNADKNFSPQMNADKHR